MKKFIKKKIKQNGFIYNNLSKTRKKLKMFLSVVSPNLSTKYLYWKQNKKRINLHQPETFSEKILWLKLNTYNDNSLVTKCADKYQVRNYVKDYGFDFLLNDLINVWDSTKEIDWDGLPDKFVIKGNHGSGYNLICTDKKKLNIKKAEQEINNWINEDFWKINSELNYKNIEKKIICERYLNVNDGLLASDYKIYCFNGVPKTILFMKDRDKETEAIFMDTDWKFIAYANKYDRKNVIPSRPASLEIMLKAARALSEPFPFVRVDFYEENGKAIFGEMTFTPAAGINPSQTEINGESMGELLDISKELSAGH